MSDQNTNKAPKIKVKKVPEIRHTKTSLKRLLNANPLMENDNINITGITNLSTSVLKPVVNKSTSLYKPKVNNQPKPAPQRQPTAKTTFSQKTGKNLITNSTANTRRNPVPKAVEDAKKLPQRKRSLSAQHFDSKKGVKVDRNKCINKLNRSRTLDNIPPSPIPEEKITFKTPSAYTRRSILPVATSTSVKKSLFRSSSIVEMSTLQKRLTDWLTKRGKSLGSYPHLKCFDLHCEKARVNEENKENIEVSTLEKTESYESLQINCDESPVKPTRIVLDNVTTVATSAIVDLQKLVQQGYPCDQCDQWLSLIQNKCEDIRNETQYWECRASIEQARGNFAEAVDCYKNAIVRGAEIKTVDESLDHLLEKFSLLNISPKPQNDDNERARIVRDARNVFKSSIIQFAIQQKKSNKNSGDHEGLNKFIATPIRRSTRLSRSHYTSTPGVMVCSSLKSLDFDFQQKIDFQENKALL